MKKAIIYLSLALFFIYSPSFLFAQGHDGLYGNEWIDYTPGKKYYKIKVTADGMYRVPASVLANAGASGINVDGIQLFHQGKEIPIHVEATNGNLNYVQFYGKKNRGEYDVHVYNDPAHHFNEEYSLYNDTATYFLTWSNVPSTQRFTNTPVNLTNLPAKEPYFMHTNKLVLNSTHNLGVDWQVATERLTKSTFEYGEGFGGPLAKVQSYSVPTEFPYNGNVNATASVKAFAKSNDYDHILTIGSSSTVYATHNIVKANVGKYSATFPNSTIQSGTTVIKAEGLLNALDQFHIAYLEVNYPRLFQFNNDVIFAFNMPASTTRKYLEIDNFDLTNAGQNQLYLYDLTNNIRIACYYPGSGNKLLTTLDPSTVDRELVLVNEGNSSAYQQIFSVSPVEFRNFDSPIFAPSNYVIITHPILKSNSTGGNPIFDYRAYRQSPAGGSFITAEIDIQELYDQFAYGITHHPLAVRHFTHYIKNRWTNPEYIYIIGKGRTYSEVRNTSNNLLIPTFGYPASDNLLVASIQSDEPTIAIGRLAATTGDQVSTYLQKIIDTEAQKNAAQTLLDKGWTKNILHLGGGKNSNEQNIIRTHLDSMKAKIERTFFGGRVESFFKSTTNPIQVAQSSYLDSLINSGVSMITFFGHSSPNSFDFNLDHPQNYNNYQKYPLIMALGCYGGSIYEAAPLISENFVFEPQAGASVFLASNGASALSALNAFAQRFYSYTSRGLYNQGASKALKQAIGDLYNSNPLFYPNTIQMVCHYMSYHGDPAFRISSADYPDYYIDDNLVSHSPELVTVQMPTFNLELDLYNLGTAIDTVFNIRVERTFPDGTVSFVTNQQVTAPYYNSLVNIPIPIGTANSLGINKFTIKIDSDNDIDEQPAPSAEYNNIVIDYCVTILSDAIVPIYPYEFAIVPNTPITLKASTGNTFAQAQTYVLQIDTTEYFNSPLLNQTTITQVGGLVEWTPSMSYMDSTVYYWRVSNDSTSPSAGYNWATSSFIHIAGSYPGWNQSHFFQYLKDEHTNVTLQEPSREFKFINTIQDVVVTTGYVHSPQTIHPENLALYFNGNKVDKCRCSLENGVYVAVVEPGTLRFWDLPSTGQPNLPTTYGAFNCDLSNRTAYQFLFKSTPNGRDSLRNFIDNVIPNDHYVFVYTLNNADALNWDQDLINTFASHGGSFINTWINNATSNNIPPWAFFFKKGDPSYPFTMHSLGTSPADAVTISGSLQEDWFQGTQTSTLIGPANYWGSMHWRKSSNANDETHVSVYGLDANQNNRELLIGPTTVLDTVLTSIDPAAHPYLELVWNTLDSINKTPAQLDYWRVIADMVPEAALRPELFVHLDSSCIQRGQEISLNIAMENISPVDMDSMLVRFAILGTQLEQYVRLDSLLSGDTLNASVTFPSTNFVGENQQLLVEINPNNDQPEKYHFNNIGLAPFVVKQDQVNPILDVTFDGVHIMNKDIVSGTPEIIVTLTDDNQYLGLDNLEDFSLILRHSSFPNGELALTPETTDMQFYPSDPTKLGEENKAKIIVHPDLKADGLYTLFVSAVDKTGNNSGDLSYSVDFEVINKPSISNLLNYPNPFTTSTQFVFTLTGRELPDYMKIQILTVTGRVVREITQEELGPLRIGINRTEYAWDGKDEFGDQLANGVYLYRVITKRNGQDYDIYSNRTDYIFRQGFGKMYLMR